MALRIEHDGSTARLWIKAVPGASRNQIGGALGERLKVRVAAPAEDGRANAAVCEVLAKALHIKPARVVIDSGFTNPEKIVRIDGVSESQVRAAFER